MANETTRDGVFWQRQGATSFVKLKQDWFPIGKVHLSFVKHKGKPQCVQDYAIEAGIDFDEALSLAASILNRELKAAVIESKKRKTETNQQYADAAFRSQGGSPAKPDKNRPCLYREITIGPGDKAEFSLGVMQCEGETNDIGGFQAKSGAKKQYIFIGLAYDELKAFAQVIVAEYTAYRSYVLQKEGIYSWRDEQAAKDTGSQQSTPAASPAAPAMMVLVYDNKGKLNRATPMMRTQQSAVAAIQEAMKALLALPEKFVKTDGGEEYDAAKNLAEGRNAGTAIINLKSKVDENQTCKLIVVVDFVQ